MLPSGMGKNKITASNRQTRAMPCSKGGLVKKLSQGLSNRLFGKRANLRSPASLCSPPSFLTIIRLTLVDENVEDIDFDRLGRADLVCLTGMSIQGRRLVEILQECRLRGVMTAVGGPMATVEPQVLEEFAEVIFVGEADETWPQFLREWEQGCHKRRYEQAEKTDMTRLPLPRVDLLKADRYMFGSLQISRGCPFTCEFCDIIVTFGPRPRLKTSEQVLAELEAFQRAGLGIIFVVDDNLIGNKKAINPCFARLSAGSKSAPILSLCSPRPLSTWPRTRNSWS
jgi:radical SAM superfamily enzyme YgiQ (UPF0313 family)